MPRNKPHSKNIIRLNFQYVGNINYNDIGCI